LAIPSSAEYWHIGEMTTRLRMERPRSCSGLKSKDWDDWDKRFSRIELCATADGSQVALHQEGLESSAMPQQASPSALDPEPTTLSALSLPSSIASGDSRPAAADSFASRRPLLVRFGAMGDMVMMTTLVAALAARHGGPVDILSSGSWTQPLLAGQPGVGQIYLLKSRSLPYLLSKEQRALVDTLRQRGAGPTWYCDHDERALKLLQRAGFDPSMVRRASQLPMRDGEHLVDYWERFAGETGSAAKVTPQATPPQATARVTAENTVGHDPRLLVSAEQIEELERWLAGRNLLGRQLLLVQPGNKRTMRRGFRRRPSNTKWWPETRWAAVLQALAQMHPQAAILMLGVPQEHALNEQIIALAGIRNAVNLACDLPIPRLLALQARASAMISVDTGPAHTAAAIGCPVLVLFGVADPVRIVPRGHDVPVRHLVGQGAGGQSMLAITVEQVLEAWQGLAKR
jgi:heptosyltransferase-2/heptosyltransferase-3